MSLVKLKDALLTVRKHTIGYTEAQAKIVSATTDYPQHGVPFVSVTHRFELARLSFNDESFEEITEILTKRLKETAKWRRVVKALIVLNYCLQEGSPRFETYCRLHHDHLKSLERFQYLFEENTDRGVLVRKEARKVLATLDDSANLTRIRQHSASVRRQQAKVMLQDSPKKEKRFSIRRRITRRYRGVASKFRTDSSNQDPKVDLEGAAGDFGPISIRQKIRAAIMSTESTLEVTVQECKDIARQTSSPADFMIILEAFIECLATDQQQHQWGQVLKAMILLRVCLTNVSEEVALEFSDDPYVSNILRGFDLCWFEDGTSLQRVNGSQEPAQLPVDQLAQALDSLTADMDVAWEVAGEVKREFESKAEPPSYANATRPQGWSGLEVAGEILATVDTKISQGPDPSSDTGLSLSEAAIPRMGLSIRARSDQSRPLPLPPTVWARLHQTAPERNNVSIAASGIRDLKRPLHATQQVSLGNQATTGRVLPSPVGIVQDIAPPDSELPPPYMLTVPDYEEQPPPISDVDAVGSLVEVDCQIESPNRPVSLADDDFDDLEYFEDAMEDIICDVLGSSPCLEVVNLPVCTPDETDDLVEPLSHDITEERPLEPHPQDLPCRSNSRPSVDHLIIPPPSPSPPSGCLSSPTPVSENLLGRVDFADSGPIAYGGFSDVFKGRMKLDDGQYQDVCVKSLRAVKMRNRKNECGARMEKRMHREMNVWQRLDHPNVVPLKGYVLDPEADESPSLVSPWYSNGNVLEYISRNPFADRKKLVRQVAQGLIHLHNQYPAIVHGDIKGGNVLIDSDGNAALADFGLSQILQECPSNSASSAMLGSVRWCAPEILMSDDYQRTLASDVWAFGVLALEILTSRQPYYTVPSDVKVVIDVGLGKVPAREDYPELPKNNRFWGVLEACWRLEPSERPSMNELASRILNDDAFAQDDDFS